MWKRIASVDDARDEDVVGVTADDGREFALYRIGGEFHVTDNWCTHGQARLSEGFVMDHCVECPLHQGQFDVRTGQPMCEPVTEAIRVYPVRVVDGGVEVEIG